LTGALFGSWSLQAAALIFFFGLGWVWLTEDDLLRSVYLVIGCLLLVLPTLHPWYLVMIAPFLCFFPSRAWLYLQASMLFTFPVLGHEFRAGVFQEIGWLKLIEYLPFFGLLFWGLLRKGDLADPRSYRAPESVSIIIPVLNEADHIGRLLADLQNRPWVQEILVSDGGSADATLAVAKAFGARVLTGEKGRGVQIRSAAEAARGDVLLILHADARLQPEATARIIAALSTDRGAAGGFFGMQFADANTAQRIIAFFNNVKAIATGISFGDQAQFVRAEALGRMGGFPGLMLMEDVELSLRMKAFGGAVYLGPGVTVSGRRWQAGNFSENIWTVGVLFFRYLLERRIGWKADDKWYHRKYYRDLA
jgi:rSAM/selenodomain-associated transferase 2